MQKSLKLGCVEFAVPGATLRDKLGVLESSKMWLEMANDGMKKLDEVLDILLSFKAPIMCVQAYRLHELELLGAGKAEQKNAIAHVEETIKIASAVGAKNIVTTITYGEPAVEDPWEKSVSMFKNFGKLAEELDVTVSIEPLGRNRTTFLPSLSKAHQLAQAVDSANVRLVADTMHIHDNGENVAEVVDEYLDDIAELQLRDTGSRPPGLGTIDFAKVLKTVRRRFDGLVCLEYKPGPDPIADFNHARKFATRIISAAR